MKILLVCDSTYFNSSGGKVARYLTKILKENGNQINIVVTSEKREDVDFDEFYIQQSVTFLPQYSNKRFNITNLLFRTKHLKKFKEILIKYSPEVVHFASFDSGKPSEFIVEAKKINAKVVLQPWIMDFYCAQGYGFRDGKSCTLCADGNFQNAIIKKCIKIPFVISLYKRFKLKNASKLADIFLSSNLELDKILIKYGVPAKKIFRFPVPFDYNKIINESTATDNKLIYFGQNLKIKGVDFLINFFQKHKEFKIKFFPVGKLDIKNSSNIQVIYNKSWNNGLSNEILSSKAVLIPSLWETTIEYVVYEALLHKKPIIIFNVGAHKYLFENYVNAFIAEKNDPISFLNILNDLQNNSKLCKEVGERGYQKLLEINNPNHLYNLLFEVYSN